MKVSISQLADLTGKDRKTVQGRCEDLRHEDGPKGAKLYDSKEALGAIYTESEAGTLEEAKRLLAVQQTSLAKLKEEEFRRERIPVEIVTEIWGGALEAFAATLKASKGKTLDADLINALLALLKEAKLPEKW